MRCANCNFENPLGKKFCSECGSGLPASCLQCGADNLPGAKFCGDCGSSLENASAQTARPSTANASRNDFSPEMRSSGGGERRHLTVLFCDLVGSTEIAAAARSRRMARDRRRVPSRGGAGDRALRRACRPVSRRRRDGVFRLARGARQRCRARRARGPRDSRRDREAQRAPRALQTLGEESASIRARWWWAQARARIPMYSATRPISRRGCRRPRNPARC